MPKSTFYPQQYAMPKKKSKILASLNKIDKFFKKIKNRYKLRLNKELVRKQQPMFIHLYRGYGTANYLWLRGRVLYNNPIVATLRDSMFRNILNTYYRFDSKEVKEVRVNVKYQNHIFTATTDQEGYFYINKPLLHPIPTTAYPPDSWQNISIEIPTQQYANAKTNHHLMLTKGEVFLPNLQNAEFGIISDIDDTLLQTHVLKKLKMLYVTFIKNAYTRIAFNGSAAWYEALMQGSQQNINTQNPIFYVSNSPHNLYDFLTDFMTFNEFPKGPIILRDLGITPSVPQKNMNPKNHKAFEIKNILALYNPLPFVLIGDSGEKDLEIYCNIATQNPHRIKAIFIRLLHKSYEHTQKINQIIKNFDQDVPIYAFLDCGEASQQSLQMGLISKQNNANVQKNMLSQKIFW